MARIPRLFRIASLYRIFRRKKSRLVIIKTEQSSEASSESRVSEGVVPEAPVGTPVPKESYHKVSDEKSVPDASVGKSISQAPTEKAVPETPAEKSVTVKDLPGALTERNIVKRFISELNIKIKHCTDCGITTPHPAKCLLGALIERSVPEVSTARPIPQETVRPTPQETIAEVAVQIQIPKELLPQASIRSETSTQIVRSKQPRATAQNNRLLALPVELRMQIYDELLAIPRTVHILEPDNWVKSNIHKVRRFDKELFSRRGRLRYKYSAPCIGYFDPRTTTFAVRFQDDENCTYRAWSTDTFNAGHGVPTSIAQVTAPVDLTGRPNGGYVMFAGCGVEARSANKQIWDSMLEQLRLRPEIKIVEVEFAKLCCMITVMKFLLVGVWEGWRELRKLGLLRIRLRVGNGGPLNIWDMTILVCLAQQLRKEMKRKVMLRRGPSVVIAW